MYVKKEYRFKDVIEIEEYHNGRFGAPGEPRRKRKAATPDQVARVNQWAKEKRCRHRLLKFFDDGDAFVTLTYTVNERPEDMDAAKKDFRNFAKKLQKHYKRSGKEFRWIRNVEVGTRGGWHIHLIIPDIPGINGILQKTWIHGKAVTQALYRKGGFKKLAAYMTKTPATDPRLVEANYSTSRNMPLPEPQKRIMRRKTWARPRVKPGWAIDKESYHEGINPVNGYPYRHFTMLRC